MFFLHFVCRLIDEVEGGEGEYGNVSFSLQSVCVQINW